MKISQMPDDPSTRMAWARRSQPLKSPITLTLRAAGMLNLLFHFPIAKEDIEKAAQQRDLIRQRVEKTPELKNMISQLETLYEIRIKQREGEKRPELSPELEEILWKAIGKEPGKA